jgi:hypothetical protein
VFRAFCKDNAYLHGSENLAEVCDATAAEKRSQSRLHHFLSAGGSVITYPETAMLAKEYTAMITLSESL